MKQELLSSKDYRHFKFKFTVPILDLTIDHTTRLYPKMEKTLGITNRTEDGYYVVFLDYDDMQKNELEKDLVRLQEDFSLPDFFVFKLDREDSWHAICLLKMTMLEAHTVMQNSSGDLAHKNAPIYFRRSRWILRIGPKGQRNPPEFALRVSNPTLPDDVKYMKPEKIYWGMLNFLNIFYEVPITPFENRQIAACKNLLVQFQPYPTFNRVR